MNGRPNIHYLLAWRRPPYIPDHPPDLRVVNRMVTQFPVQAPSFWEQHHMRGETTIMLATSPDPSTTDSTTDPSTTPALL